MEITKNLKDFVNICNTCTYEAEKSPKDASKKLALDFRNISEWEKINRKIENNREPIKLYDVKNNLSFYICLKKRNIENEYGFLWDKNIVAKLNVWEPLSDKDILSQKWHILISVLAFLDTAANDPNFIKYGGEKKYAKFKNIESISFNADDCRYLKFDGRIQLYTSKPMKEWLGKALDFSK